uniref:Uncharacterized protein n=1 Tax=Rhizophora mucronata TaxID=61149 RepID=A0A2P2MXT7_RHIMU
MQVLVSLISRTWMAILDLYTHLSIGTHIMLPVNCCALGIFPLAPNTNSTIM